MSSEPTTGEAGKTLGTTRHLPDTRSFPPYWAPAEVTAVRSADKTDDSSVHTPQTEYRTASLHSLAGASHSKYRIATCIAGPTL